jgi:tetratricopeptide (TPR) repeat protein
MLITAVAAAQPSVDPAAEFSAGVAAFDQAQYDVALAAFERSYDARAVPGVLYNIAATLLRLERHDEAEATYRRYLAEDPAITPERRTEVLGILDELDRRVARLVLHVQPEGTEVRIDGQLAGVAPLGGPLVLDPGEHTIELVREDHVFEPVTLTLEGGIDQTMTLRARHVPPPVLAPRPDPVRDRDRERDREGGGLLSSPVFWIVTGIVVVGAGTATTWYLTQDEEAGQTLHAMGPW